ncbi:MAG TPA: MerR family transcriptional regulator [Pseudonocardia sp.]|nr:MerR family transcriptional regulator [Pseudonocardia sp.]
MRIGELARSVGLSERALRYYEEQGLLRPARKANGYRHYTEADATTVRHIRTLLDAGLPSTVIAELLPCVVDTGDGLDPACPELLTQLFVERNRISAAIDHLASTRTLLDAVISASTPAPARDRIEV